MNQERATRLVDSAREGTLGSGRAKVVLAAGMVISAVLALWLGRKVSFSVDEYSWISLAGESGLSGVFEPYVGHLVVIPRFIYWAVLEATGIPGYAFFQVLTLLSLFLMIGLLFVWLRKRVPDFVALAPCLVLLIFPVDHLHYLTGNGIVISLALAFGLAALLAWERSTTGGNLLAFGFLLLGLLTYTIAVPFAIGLVVAAALAREWRRAWIGLVPLVLYAVWRLLAVSNGVEKLEGGPEWENLLLLPAWAFQSIGAILAALTGLGFDFSDVTGGPAVEQGRVLGPALATVALLGLAWWLVRGRGVGKGFWMTGAILFALLASQVLVWGTISARDPGAPRYLLPGAVVLVMVVATILVGVKWSRVPFLALWVVAISSVVVSIGILANNVTWLETVDRGARAEVTAIRLLESSGKPPIPPSQQPRNRVRSEFMYESASKYGDLGFYEELIEEEPTWVGARVDRFLAESLRIGLGPVPLDAKLKGCRPASTASKPSYSYLVRVPSPGVTLVSQADVSLGLGRYGERPTIELGRLTAGEPRFLWLPGDRGRVEWYLKALSDSSGTLADVELCNFP
jgi:hypothetical protein